MLAFSDGCCPKIYWYRNGKKHQGSFIIQDEKINGNCYYLNKKTEWGPRGIWMCEDSWWYGKLSDKGQCKGIHYASKSSKPNVHVQDDLLQWKRVKNEEEQDFDFNCVDVCL